MLIFPVNTFLAFLAVGVQSLLNSVIMLFDIIAVQLEQIMSENCLSLRKYIRNLTNYSSAVAAPTLNV